MPKIIKVKNHWKWNIATKQCWFSENWCKSLGFEPDELIHHEDTWKSLVHEECMPRVWRKLQPVLLGEIDVYRCRYRLKNKQNQYIWHLDIGRVIERDAAGQAVIMEGHDIPLAA